MHRIPRVLVAVQHRAGQEQRTDGVKPVFESSDDPEFPPPPRMPQNRSAFSVSLARSTRPSAVTISAAIRLSQVSPYLRPSLPKPPPSVSRLCRCRR